MSVELYNPDVKNRFLATQESEGTRYVYRSVLVKCAVTERFYSKDVCNFTYEEYTQLLYSFNAKSPNSITTYNSIVSSYIEYANKIGFSDPDRLVDNVAKMFTRQDLLQFIRADAMEYQYLNSDELDEFVNFCANEQDAALIQAIREGVRGVSGDELLNLRIQDIDVSNCILHLRGKNGERKLKVGQKTIDLLVSAHRQEKYWKRNGESTNKKVGFAYLPHTDFIFKPTGQYRTEPATYQILRRRLSALAEWHDNAFLNITNVWKSGMIEYGQQIKKENDLDHLTVRHYEEISERYGRTNTPENASALKMEIGMYIDG